MINAISYFSPGKPEERSDLSNRVLETDKKTALIATIILAALVVGGILSSGTLIGAVVVGTLAWKIAAIVSVSLYAVAVGTDLVVRKQKLDQIPDPFTNHLEPVDLPPVGIPNQGNTCFAAAWMQLIANSPTLAGSYRAFLPAGHSANQFLNTYRLKQQGSSVELPISKLRRVLPMAWFAQEDAQELGQKIADSCKISPIRDGKITVNGKSVQMGTRTFERLRSGEQRSVGEGYQFPMFPLYFTRRDSEEGIVARFFHYFSNSTRKLTEMVAANLTNQTLVPSPDDLIFSLVRQGFNGRQTTVVREPVEVPISFSFGGVKRELRGFVSHLGTTGESGHYIAHVKKAGSYYRINDSLIVKITEKQFLDAARAAYIVHYSKA